MTLPSFYLLLLQVTDAIRVDPAVIVQVELAIIGLAASGTLRLLWIIYKRLTVIDSTMHGPDGDGKTGLISDFNQLKMAVAVGDRLRLRTMVEHVSWRRRVETALHEINPNFECTPDHILLDLITGEDPQHA